MTRIPVYVEVGRKRVFASALDWPGWSRAGRTEDDALDALVRYAGRYASVIGAARVDFTPRRTTADLDIAERVGGGAGTDFGVPSEPARSDERPLAPDEPDRLRTLLTAVWAAFDAAAARAAGAELRKGPRGGGRDVEKIRAHVLEAEAAYARSLGGRPPNAAADADVADGMAAVRSVALETFVARGTGVPVSNPSATRSPWSVRYYVRRSAWHALDHAWEVEDRSAPDVSR